MRPEAVIPIPQLKPDYLGCLVSGLTAGIALDQVYNQMVCVFRLNYCFDKKCGEIKSGDKVFITAAAGGTGLQH